MTIDELARRIADWRALELAAARLLGEWIPVVEPARWRPVLAGWADHLAWHVDLWDTRAPAIPGVDLLADTPTGRSAPVVDRAAGVDALIDVLVTEVFEPMIAELDTAGASIDPRLDAPTARIIGLILDDLRRDLAEARSVASGR